MDTYDYKEWIEIPSYALDGKLKATPTFIFNILQMIADNHVNKYDIGWEFLHEKGMFWALSKMDVSINRRPVWKEKVMVRTWGKGRNQLIQPRDYQIISENGEVLVSATSNWVILDSEGKPRFLEEIVPGLRFMVQENALEKPATRLRTPVKDQVSDYKPVTYSNIDMNRHANNSAYITWLMDDFSVEFHADHELEFLSVNYLQQTHYTDRYAVMQNETAPNEFLASVVTQSGTEVCRLATKWKTVVD